MQIGLAEAWRSRVAGQPAESLDRLAAESTLAYALLDQGKSARAERVLRALHEVEMRVLGAEHRDTLTSANNLAWALSRQGKYADAERIQREVHEVKMRVLGAEHPDTLASANNLAMSLTDQGKYTEAERMLHATFASLQRVLGPTHPNTMQIASTLEQVRARIKAIKAIRATPPTDAAAPAAAGAARALPAGARVLVQRLVAKPEHNGKRARVLSFDVRTGRYAVALDDGKELSLKAECVAKAGCAAAGCASEEASSACSRCQAVRYCSRECQRTDWKAHKPVCTAAQR
jgi:hypothetical protein